MTPDHSILRHNYWLIILGVYLFCCTACEEYYRPDLEGVEPLLVVEGSITDQPGPYIIALSFSSGIYSSEHQTVENAAVRIIEESGEEELLTETIPGSYATSENGIRGTTGSRYKVSIQLEDGRQYESPFQELLPSIGIDSVEAAVEYHFIDLENSDVPGYQFYVTTALAENRENYFLWSLEYTFKYRTDFTIDYFYTDGIVQPYPNPSEFRTCWRTDPINEIYTFNTGVQSQPKVERLPINFARADERELAIRYSLLVKQLVINEEAYTFWNNIQRQIEGQESLYTVQPFQFRGNLSNIHDPDEKVLGFFMVAAQNEKRVFVDPPPGLDTDRMYCDLDYMSYGFLGLFPPSSWPIYIYEDAQGGRALASESCFDCRELGGTTTEPDFWEE